MASVLSYLTVSTIPSLHWTNTWVSPQPGSVAVCPLSLHSPKGNQLCALLTFPVRAETPSTLTLQQHTLMLPCPLSAYPPPLYTVCTFTPILHALFPVGKNALIPYSGLPNGPALWESNSSLWLLCRSFTTRLRGFGLLPGTWASDSGLCNCPSQFMLP